MKETYRDLAVIVEIENSIKYLRNGLAEIQRISVLNDFYDPLLIYLSGGFERLFKSMLCLNYKEEAGRLPETNEIWNNRNGHDIIFLKKKIEQICVPIKQFTKNDYDIITQDEIINKICKILSSYGSRARYFNLDVILGKEQEFDAKKEWERMEDYVFKNHYGVKKFCEMMEMKRLDYVYKESNKLLISKIELFLRAIMRQFIFGNFSSEAKSYIYQIATFVNIDDKQLGETDYIRFQNNEIIRK